MKKRKARCLFLCFLCVATACCGLFGCKSSQAVSSPVSTPAPTAVNDGRAAKLVLGELNCAGVPDDTAVLEEIAEKYRADFPNTEIEVKSYESFEDIERALQNGELDLAQLPEDRAAALAKAGDLWDFSRYLDGWEDYAAMASAAKLCISALGEGTGYLIPCDMTLDLLYYRTDWVDQYNEGREESDWVYSRTWAQLTKAGTQLENGGLAFAGKDRLVDYFNSILWSTIGQSRTASDCAAYFAPGEEGETIFSSQRAADGLEEFLQVLASSGDSLSYTVEDAVNAFLEGKVAFLLADRSVMATLREKMPEGSWDVKEYPKGTTNTAVQTPQDCTGWAISASCEEKEIAFCFLSFLSNADNNTHYAKVLSTEPLHTTAENLEPSFEEGDLAVDLEMISESATYRYSYEPTMYEAWAGWQEQADAWLRELIDGGLTREELLSNMDRYWKEAYQAQGNLWS